MNKLVLCYGYVATVMGALVVCTSANEKTTCDTATYSSRICGYATSTA